MMRYALIATARALSQERNDMPTKQSLEWAKKICDSWNVVKKRPDDPPLQTLIAKALDEAFNDGIEAAFDTAENFYRNDATYNEEAQKYGFELADVIRDLANKGK